MRTWHQHGDPRPLMMNCWRPPVPSCRHGVSTITLSKTLGSVRWTLRNSPHPLMIFWSEDHFTLPSSWQHTLTQHLSSTLKGWSGSLKESKEWPQTVVSVIPQAPSSLGSHWLSFAHTYLRSHTVGKEVRASHLKFPDLWLVLVKSHPYHMRKSFASVFWIFLEILTIVLLVNFSFLM